MKKHFLILAILFTTIYTNTQAKIWRVNNTPGVQADFSDGQVAVTYALSGDTIYFEPSLINYGDLGISSKSLAIFTNSDKNRNFGNTSNYPNTVFATLGQVFLSNCNNMFLSIRYTSQILIHGSQNITIENSVFSNVLTPNDLSAVITVSNNIVIKKSKLYRIQAQDVNNLSVLNNIIDFGISTKNSNGVILNNTIKVAPLGTDPIQVSAFNLVDSIKDFIFQNNIFVYKTNTFFQNCTINNNTEVLQGGLLGVNNLLAVGDTSNNTYTNGNNNGILNSVFNLSNGISLNEDEFWDNTSKVNFNTRGAYSGSDKYTTGAPPPIPAITNLQIPTINSGTNMNVIFSATSNK